MRLLAAILGFASGLLTKAAVAAIAFGAASSGNASGTNPASLALDIPTNSAGEAMFACAVLIHDNGDGHTLSTPSGWTSLASISSDDGTEVTHVYLFGKISTGSETTVTVSPDSSTEMGDLMLGGVAVYNGTLNTMTGIVAHSSTSATDVSDNSTTTPALTITTDNTLVISCAGNNIDTADDPVYSSGPSWLGNVRSTIDTAAGDDGSMYLGDAIQTTATNIAASTWECSGTCSPTVGPEAALTVSIKPAATAGAAPQRRRRGL